MKLEEDILKDSGYLPVTREQIRRFSPNSGAILEACTERDLEILQKLYTNGVLLGDKSEKGWNIRYATEFHMTNDSKLFPRRQVWEDKGYRPDEYGHWLKGGWQAYSGPENILSRREGLIMSVDGNAAIHVDDIEDVALPLYQGAMIHQFDFCAAGFSQSEGRRGFTWKVQEWGNKEIHPQYLMNREDFLAASHAVLGFKTVFRPIARTSDTRTFICTSISAVPCGHSISLLVSPHEYGWALPSMLNTFVFDWATRLRLVGTNLSFFVVADLPLLSSSKLAEVPVLQSCTAAMLFPHNRFAPAWCPLRGHTSWRSMWAVSEHERLRRRTIIEVVSAKLYGLSLSGFEAVMAECDLPADHLASKPVTRSLNSKGFWRLDKDKDPELRLAVLAQVAFHELERVGLDEFLAMNNGEGWMLPETLRLADYGLGHDDRAKEPQPVAPRLGPRFYDWQIQQGVEESWEECERHAEILDRILPAEEDVSEVANEDGEGRAPTDLFGNPLPTDLFGNVLLAQKKGRR